MKRITMCALALAAAGGLLGLTARAAWAQGGSATASLRSLEQAAGARLRVTRSRTLGLPTFIGADRDRPIPVSAPPSAGAAERASAFMQAGGAAFGLESTGEVSVGRVHERDEVGMDHVRLQQVHKGIPIRGGELIVHLRDGGVIAANGKTLPEGRGVDTTPSVKPEEALVAAEKLLAARKAATGATFSAPRLEILNPGFLFDSAAQYAASGTRLTWFVEARAAALREFIWIDARDGSIPLHVDQFTEARNRRIYDADNGWTLPGSLMRAEGDPPTGDLDADNAYDYAGDTYNYFFDNHGRDSYDNAGATLISSVHYCEPGDCPLANAGWDGSQMVYGAGFSRADDVVAHELTHAVTERSANLIYCLQSGALNESYSDIFGETVDLTNTGGTDTPAVRWLEGEDLPGIGAIRNMMNPNAFADPGKMSDSEFYCASSCSDYDNGGVHINSGVPNHAYALLVDGGTFNGHTVTGIGLAKAAKIAYRALTLYLTAASTFADNYDALNQSCADLVGTAGITIDDCAEVTAALDAVEMSKPACGTPTTCGDGNVDPGELCDDGNTEDGDGCDSNCTPTACGNGIVTAPEACDDGNAVDGDGCQADCTVTPGCAVYASTDVPKPLPDQQSALSTLAVSAGARITNVQIVNLDASHTWVSDLEFRLRSPAGTQVTVIDRVCNNEDGFHLNLADWAGSAIPCPPNDGRFHKPRDPLSAFNGERAKGEWTLIVSDKANLDEGSLQGWGLAICTSSVCEAAPAGDCRAGGESLLRIRNSDNNGADGLLWKSIGGAAANQNDFGDPTSTTPYALCVYDSAGLVFDAAVPPGGTCGSKPCWSVLGGAGYRYADRARANDGISKIVLQAGNQEDTKILLRGRGRDLAVPELLLGGPVRAQLINRDSGLCFESLFTAPFTKNDQSGFKAKTP